MGGERSEQWYGVGNFQGVRGSREIWGMHLGEVNVGFHGNPFEEACVTESPLFFRERDVLWLFHRQCCWRLGHVGGLGHLAGTCQEMEKGLRGSP